MANMYLATGTAPSTETLVQCLLAGHCACKAGPLGHPGSKRVRRGTTTHMHIILVVGSRVARHTCPNAPALPRKLQHVNMFEVFPLCQGTSIQTNSPQTTSCHLQHVLVQSLVLPPSTNPTKPLTTPMSCPLAASCLSPSWFCFGTCACLHPLPLPARRHLKHVSNCVFGLLCIDHTDVCERSSK